MCQVYHPRYSNIHEIIHTTNASDRKLDSKILNILFAQTRAWISARWWKFLVNILIESIPHSSGLKSDTLAAFFQPFPFFRLLQHMSF